MLHTVITIVLMIYTDNYWLSARLGFFHYNKLLIDHKVLQVVIFTDDGEKNPLQYGTEREREREK